MELEKGIPLPEDPPLSQEDITRLRVYRLLAALASPGMTIHVEINRTELFESAVRELDSFGEEQW